MIVTIKTQSGIENKTFVKPNATKKTVSTMPLVTQRIMFAEIGFVFVKAFLCGADRCEFSDHLWT
jgi:hypothetical protein